ncbi:MAG: PDZ domain-containing protein [Pirellulaceae bacterium]|nr:PDZ domain-containing protein [Pirellulaceae bacterium]MDP7018651.1 PDZ domain-containing protein [Pirellulaceae bacterium]
MNQLLKTLPLLLVIGWASPVWGQAITLLEEQAMQSAVDRVADSVVRIETFGGLEKVGNVVVGAGPTSGVIVSPDGHILSSAYGFVQKPSSILVRLPNGRRTAAKILARDHARMLVLLKVESEEKLVPVEPVAVDTMAVGQWSIAVGRTFSPDHANISVGVISALNRIWGKALQTDAKISPSNYGGALIDINGRVFGVLAPMSPQASGELAGSEWYDSGIGFAVPLVDTFARLDVLKKGEDLYPGLMGIGLDGSDIYSKPAVVGSVRAKSPAREAGLEAGDVIVEVDGAKITRQAQLKHALGPHYAGDRIKVSVVRGEDKKRIDVEMTLVKELIPYDAPFLGVLPIRFDDRAGVGIRHIFADSPAAKAALTTDDRIVEIDGKAVENTDRLRALFGNLEAKQTIELKVQRGDATREVSLDLGALPQDLLASLPSPPAPAELGEAAWADIKLPEEPNECGIFTPASYNEDTPHGLLVILHAPGAYNREAMEKQWGDLCQDRQLLLLAPKSSNDRSWTPTEVQFIQKTLDHVLNEFNIDAQRVVLGGVQAGGAMAYLTAASRLDVVRGVVAVDAPLPRRVRPPAADPQRPISFFTIGPEKSRLKAAIDATVKALRKQKHSVVFQQGGAAGKLSDAERSAIARWIDTLDRL